MKHYEKMEVFHKSVSCPQGINNNGISIITLPALDIEAQWSNRGFNYKQKVIIDQEPNFLRKLVCRECLKKSYYLQKGKIIILMFHSA